MVRLRTSCFKVFLSLAAFVVASLVTGAVRAEGIDLKVEVSGLRNFKGRVVLYLWSGASDRAAFPDQGKVQVRDERQGDEPCDIPAVSVCRRLIESLQNLTVSYTFKRLPPGDYSLFVFHDENNNGVLDTGVFGRPLEARGYSQVLPEDVSPIVDKIKFDRAQFTLNEPKTMLIGLRYPPRL